MFLRVWGTTLVLASFWLTSPLITSVLADQTIATSQSSNSKLISVTKAEFGVERVGARGNVTFIPTMRVPLQEKKRYGWRIQLKDYKGEVTWREVLRLPKQPENWGTDNGENFSLSANGTEGVTTRTQKAPNGMIENFWTIAPGDPSGKHKIEVYIDNRRIAAFEFEVVRLKQ
jgi:hypothetical protein